jgi:hypothetical protein
VTAVAAGPGTVASTAVTGRQVRLGWTWPERLVAAAAVVGTLMSTSHLYAFAVASGVYSPVEAVGLPLLVEVLMLALSRIALARADRGERGGLAAFGFFALVAVAVAVNYARGNPDIIITDLGEAAQAVPAVLPPLSATLAYKVLQGERRARARQLLTVPPATERPSPSPSSTVATGRVEDEAAGAHRSGAGAPAASDGEAGHNSRVPMRSPAREDRDLTRPAGQTSLAAGGEAAGSPSDGQDGLLVLAAPRREDGHRHGVAGHRPPVGHIDAPTPASAGSGGHAEGAAGHGNGHGGRIGESAGRDSGHPRGEYGPAAAGGRPAVGVDRDPDRMTGVSAQSGQDPWDRIAAAVAANPGAPLTKSWVAETTGIPRTTVRRLIAEHELEWDRWIAARSGSADGSPEPAGSGGGSRRL